MLEDYTELRIPGSFHVIESKQLFITAISTGFTFGEEQ